MTRVETVTTTCPCCKYQYRIMQHYEMITENGKTIRKNLGGGIPRGHKEFSPVNVVGENGNIVTIAIECPQCGIHINPTKCTKKTDKAL